MVRRIFLIGTVLAILISAGLGMAYRSAVQGPDFYRELMREPWENLRAAGESMEEKILDLHNAAVREDSWSATFSQSEINGWLAAHLPDKYPRQNPRNISGLRVRLSNGQIQLAFRLEEGPLKGVVCIHLEIFMTSESRNIGLRIADANMGWIPVPKKKVVDQINAAARKAGLELVWTQENNDPTALLLPHFNLEKSVDRKMTFREVSIENDTMVLSGTAADRK